MLRPTILFALVLVPQLLACKRGEPKHEGGPGELAFGTHAPAAPSFQHPPIRSAPSAAAAAVPRDVAPSGKVESQTVEGFVFDIPSEWQPRKSGSAMRLAEYILPGPGGDAELLLFRFPGGAGSIEANLTRWKSQFSPPAGKTLDDVSAVTKLEIDGFKLTLLDVTGTNTAGMGPAAAGAAPKPNQRMLATIAEGSGDPLFFKCVGPAQTVSLWASAHEAMLRSLRLKQ